ncbi:ribonuclease H-like domain-containing protein [Tanacetum coccineum]|uniref:Ribonuclease H-like domain-containing protein n=1 Tax=Tanacetum coccineum TaxID=301880 RepID=A0ABQ5DF38_9ASTR
MVHSMMSQTTLQKSFWDYALESAAHILNMVSTKKVDKTPYEVWHWKVPKLSYLKVIENGNSWVPIPVTAPESGPSTALKMTVPSTAEEKICKKNDVKARSLLLMALPNEHQLTFNQYVDAQSMFVAIKARFGGNDATKKTQKALLKQQYENFNAISSESLDSIFNRLQKLVSRLAILGVDTPPEDLNVKFLRSLPSEWDTHVVVWMNKPDFDTMGLDDLYNNFKIVEQKVKRTVAANNDDKNLAFLTTSSPSSTNSINTVNTGVSTGTTKVNTASTETSTASFSDATVYAFLSTQPQGSQLVHEDLEQLHDDDLEEMDLKWNMALLSMRARKFYQRTGRKIIIDGSSTAGYDKSKVECFNCHKMGHFARECRAPRSKDNRNWNQGSSSKAVRIEDASEKAMCAIDGAGNCLGDMAEDEIQANMALMAFTDSEVSNDKSCSKSCLQNYEALKKQYDDLLVKLDDTGFKASTYKRGLSILEGQIIKYKESEVLFFVEIALLKRSVGHKEYLIGLLKTELEKVKEEKEGFEFKIAKFEKSSKDLDQLLASQITDKSKKGFGYNVVPSPHPLILNRPTPLDLSYSGLQEFKQPEVNEYGLRDSSVMPITDCDKESDNSKENTDDSLKQQQKTDSSLVKSPLKVDKDWKEKFFCPANQVRVEASKKARENNDAPIIEDWVLDDEEEVEPIPKVEKKTVIPTATKKEFVKPAKPIRKSVSSLNEDWPKYVNNASALLILFSVANTARPFSTARSFNTVRPSYTAYPKSTVLCARPKTHFQNQAQSTIQRPFYKRTALTKRSNNQNINTGRQTVNTVRQNVNTVRARGFNAVKPSACWVWRPIKPNGASLSNSQLNDKEFVDSGSSRHMSGNIAHLSDFKDFDGGYVTFGGGANGGRITGKGTIKTDKLDFDDLCLVLSPNFKLPDENKILLKIPRQNNMYSFDMKNIVPKDGLTYLVAKATSEESMLWHRRLGHVNFKNINKLVKENLVRDLPLKRFENDQTCVACLKGKQHRASCKTKAFSPITKPLMMDEFCREKGIKREYSVARTPQQNGIVKGSIGLLLRLSRTNVSDSSSTSFWAQKLFLLAAIYRHSIQGVSESSTSSQPDQDNQDCIVMPIWKDASYFDDASPRSVADAQLQDQNGTHDDCSLQNNGIADQQVNTACPEVNSDTYVEDQEIELGNISQSYAVSSTPHTRIHKDHLIDHEDSPGPSYISFAVSYLKKNKKSFIKALSDPAHSYWYKVGLRIKKEERGIVIRNKADCFEDLGHPDKVYKVVKALYGLHQAPRAWSAEATTDDNGEVHITATIDGHSKTITEASLRRHLKLDDHDGITSIPNSEIFEQLALMGYQTDSDKLTFQKGAFSPQWRFLIHTILHCLSPKKTAWEQFSSNIATAVICLATNRKFNFSRLIFEHMVSNVSSLHKFLMYPSIKVFNNMERPTKGYSGQEVALFHTMLNVAAPSTSPSRITFSPSYSPEPSTEHSPEPSTKHSPEPSTEHSLEPLTEYSPDHTTAVVSFPSPKQPTQPSPRTEQHIPTPHDSSLYAVHSHGSDEVLEDDLKKAKLTYSAAVTKLILRVKKLEFQVKTGKARRRARVVLSEDDADLPIIQEVTPTEVIQDQGSSEKGNSKVSTAGATKGTASEVLVISTAEVNISTARRTVTSRRRSEEKRTRKDKGKAIMTEPEPKK